MKTPEVPWSIPAQFGFKSGGRPRVKDLALSSVIPDFAIKDDLSGFATRDDLSGLARKSEISSGVKVGTGEIHGQYGFIAGTDNVSYTDNSIAFGSNAQAGSRSFGIVSGDISLSSLTLDSADGIRPGMKVAYRLLNNYNVFGYVTAVDTQTRTITLSGMPKPSRNDELLSDPYLEETGNPLYDPSSNLISVHYGYYVISPEKKFTPEAKGGRLDYDIVSQLWVIGRPDLGTRVQIMEDAFAHGWGCVAQGSQSHAEGRSAVAYGRYSHAEGSYTLAGYDSHAEGYFTWAGSHWSHSDGSNAVAKDSRSYVWNGVYDPISAFPNQNTYYSNGGGTFNVNPAGGARGFFVGLSSLDSLIRAGGGGLPPSALLPLSGWIQCVEKDVKDIQDAFGEAEYEPVTDLSVSTGTFITYQTGRNSAWETAQATDFVPCRPGDTFRFSFNASTNIAPYCLYDENKKFLSSLNADMTQKPDGSYKYEDYLNVSRHIDVGQQADYDVEIPAGCGYIKFSSYMYNIPPGNLSSMNVRKKKISYSRFLDRIARIEQQLEGLGSRLDEIMD